QEVGDAVAVVCPWCGKHLRAPARARGRRLTCPGCGERMEVPAEEVEPAAVDRAFAHEHAPLHPDRPLPLLLAAIACLLLGLGAAPIAVVSKLGVTLSQSYPLPDFGPLGLLFMAPIGLALAVGGIGLLRRQPWAWSLALMSLLCGTAYYAKLVLPVYLTLRWEHPAARSIAVAVGLFQGLPLLLFVVGLVLVFLPSVRATMRTARAHPRRHGTRHAHR
ncbi:MAG TPA: hypothetical protein VF530_04615, partial [Planctomycetota bacterium]